MKKISLITQHLPVFLLLLSLLLPSMLFSIKKVSHDAVREAYIKRYGGKRVIPALDDEREYQGSGKRNFCRYEGCQTTMHGQNREDHENTHLKQKPYCCLLCGFLTSWFQRIKSHIKRHNVEPENDVQYCILLEPRFIKDLSQKIVYCDPSEKEGIILNDSRGLDLAKFSINPDGIFVYTDERETRSWAGISHHENIHLEQGKYCCLVCFVLLSSRADIKKHVRKHEFIDTEHENNDQYCILDEPCFIKGSENIVYCDPSEKKGIFLENSSGLNPVQFSINSNGIFVYTDEMETHCWQKNGRAIILEVASDGSYKCPYCASKNRDLNYFLSFHLGAKHPDQFVN